MQLKLNIIEQCCHNKRNLTQHIEILRWLFLKDKHRSISETLYTIFTQKGINGLIHDILTFTEFN